MIKRFVYCCAAAAALVALPNVTFAQTEGGHESSPQEAAPPDKIEEVMVTARRSAENIQSVPVAISALSAEQLRDNSITNPEDLQMAIPGVYLFGASGRQNTTFIIRGQGRGLGSISPGVIPYFADVPNPYLGNFVPQFDLSSVQVLKGPQGTLFGRNTTGGAILYTPAAPTEDFEGYVQLGYGSYNDRDVDAVLNIPASDKILFRLGVSRHLRDGYTKDLNHPGRNLDNVDDTVLRATMLLKPFNGFTNSTIVDYYRGVTHGFSAELTDVLPPGTLLDQLGIRQSYLDALAEQRARGPLTVAAARPMFEHNRRLGVTNRTDWTVGSVEFVNIFGYRNTSLAFSRDSGTPRAIADGSGVLPAGTPLDLIVAATEDHTDQFTDEVQLHGQALTGRLQWLVGGFYLKSKPAGPQSNLVGFAEVPGYDTATTSYNFITETSKAVFGDLRVDLGDLLDGLQFEAGARRTWDKIRSCTASGNSSGNILPEECDAASPLLINPAIEVASSVSNARPNLGKN